MNTAVDTVVNMSGAARTSSKARDPSPLLTRKTKDQKRLAAKEAEAAANSETVSYDVQACVRDKQTVVGQSSVTLSSRFLPACDATSHATRALVVGVACI